MILNWGSASWNILFFSVFSIFFFLKRFVLTWFVLEVSTWRMFYIFSLKWNKKSLQRVYTFFLIQSICSIGWMIGFFFLYLEEGGNEVFFLRLFTIMVSLIFKIGFFPAHFWVWQIYSQQTIWPVFMISTLQKLIPLILIAQILVISQNGGEIRDLIREKTIEIILILNFLLILFNISFRENIFRFFFFSGLLHYRIIILLMKLRDFSTRRIYLFTYWISSLLFLLLRERKNDIFFNKRIIKNKSLGEGMFLGILLSGFPPRALFFIKGIVFNILRFNLNSFFLFLLVSVFVVYIYSLIFFFLTRIKQKKLNINLIVIKKKLMDLKTKTKEFLFLIFFCFINFFFIFFLF